MKMKSLLGIVLSLSILQSCQNDETNIIQNEVNNKGITFSSIIDDAQNSRAYDTSWEANDVIGVFMLANNSDKNVLATNIPYATSKGDGYFVSKNSPIYYPEDNSAVDFIAYYPYTTSVSGNKLAVNVSDQSNPAAIDLIYSNGTKGVAATTATTISLGFTHQLTKVTLNVTKDETIETLNGLGVNIKGISTEGEFNLADGTLAGTTGTNNKDVAMYVDVQDTNH